MHWITKFRQEYKKDGKTGISMDELAKMVRQRKMDKHYVGCSGKLISILEHGGITHPRIAAVIVMVCGGTAEQWNGIVHEDYHGQWKPGWKTEFAPRFEINEEGRMAVTIVSHGEIKRGKAPKHAEPKPPKSEPAEPKPKKKQKTEPQIREIVQIGTDFREIARYPSVAAAADAVDVNTRMVSIRCNRLVSDETDEMNRLKCTWRYADEWDTMTPQQRTEDMQNARKRIRRDKKHAALGNEAVSEGGDAHQPVGRA